MFKTLALMSLAVTVFLPSLSTDVDARPRKQRSYVTQVCKTNSTCSQSREQYLTSQYTAENTGSNYETISWPANAATFRTTPETRVRRQKQKSFQSSSFSSGGDTALVSEARRWIGASARTLGLHRYTLWCATAMNKWVKNIGGSGTGSDFAKSFASKPRTTPRVGAIAVMSRKGGGHVGVVSGFDARGNPIIISGNSRGGRVAEGVYPRGRVYAWVSP